MVFGNDWWGHGVGAWFGGVGSTGVTGTLYVHVFDVGLAEGGISGVHKTVLDQERVLRAFASHDELVDAGYVPGLHLPSWQATHPVCAVATGKPRTQYRLPASRKGGTGSPATFGASNA